MADAILHNLLAQVSITNVLVVVVVIIALHYLWTIVKARATLPSGPIPWPIVGSTFTLAKLPERELMDMRKRYGDVFTVFIGSKPCIVINGVDNVKEALLKNSITFGGRPKLELFRVFEIPDGPKGLSATDYSPTLRLHRKVAHTAIRNYTHASGSDAARFEEHVRGEILKLLEQYQTNASEPIDILPDLLKSVTNLIFTVCFGPGKVEKYLSQNILEQLSLSISLFDEWVVMNNLFDTFPRLFNLLTKLPIQANKEFEEMTQKFLTMIHDELEDHKQTYESGSVRDIFDALIQAKREAEEQDRDDKAAMFDDNSLIGTIGDIFFGGMQTTSYTVYWYLLFMITHPEIQQKVHDELDKHVGRNNHPTVENRSSLKYLEASILETLRVSSIVPLSLPHAPMKDIEIFGHKIPKGTPIWVNLWSVHQDEKLWSDPKEFKPERFIDSNGEVIKSPNLMPFSVGTRTCVGESLARYELYMYISHLMNHFEFKIAEPRKNYSYQPRAGLVHSCKPYKLIITPRK